MDCLTFGNRVKFIRKIRRLAFRIYGFNFKQCLFVFVSVSASVSMSVSLSAFESPLEICTMQHICIAIRNPLHFYSAFSS